MNENIGAKGGSNDNRRMNIIKENKKKKLIEEEIELKELEDRVKKNQKITLIRTIPIVVAGGVFQTLYDTVNKTDKDKEKSREIREHGVDLDKAGAKVTGIDRKPVNIGVGTSVKDNNITDVNTNIKTEIRKNNEVTDVNKYIEPTNYVEEKIDFREDKKLQGRIPVYDENGKRTTSESTSGGNIKIGEKNKSYSENIKGIEESFTQIIESTHKDLEKDLILNQYQEKIDQLKTQKIIEEYERLFKDIRFELRRTIYEYDVIIDQNDVIILSDEAQNLLDKLSDMIVGIESLKAKVMVDDIEKYDNNYLYVLIQDYLKDFRDNKIVEEVKNSNVYIDISDKLEELEIKRDKLKEEIERKKEEFELREVNLEKLHNDFYSIDRLNNELEDFQNEQKYLIVQLENKMKNAVSITEKTKYEVQTMDVLTRRMMRLMAFQMFLPGPRFTRAIATTGAAYLHFLNRIINPPTIEKKYSVIKVQDYRKDLEYNLASIDDASKMINRTSEQIDKMISEIKNRYHDYLGVIPECDSLLNNLNRVKRDMSEKEYEMRKIRKEQELILEINNAKVKTMGEYPIN